MGLRLLPLAAMLVGALALGACGDDDGGGVVRACSPDTPGSEEWAGEGRLASGNRGAAVIAEFNAFLESADPPISTSPCDAARVFLHVDREGPTHETAAVPEDSADAVVKVTLSDLADDSVRAERWTLSFEAGTGDLTRLVDVRVAYSCQPGRGHAKFGTKLCI